MGEYWDRFIFGFCKAEFVCWQGEPNWLGWMVLALVVPLTLFFSFMMVGAFAVLGDYSERFSTKFVLFLWMIYFATLFVIIMMHFM